MPKLEQAYSIVGKILDSHTSIRLMYSNDLAL